MARPEDRQQRGRSRWPRNAARGRAPGTRRRIALMILAGFLVLLGFFWQRCGVRGCPNVDRLKSYQPGGATVLIAADGEQFADLSPVEHAVVSLDSLPPYVPAAFVAVEDHRFFQHHGVDYRRVVGAAVADIKALRFAQGFSTITMQLARNVFPDRLPGQKRTLRRKVLEMRVARDIENTYEKNAILELYLNHIYFGSGAYGIEAASRNYFGKPARALTVGEAALLAALPKSPTLYNPRRFTARAAARRDLVLTLMERHGHINADERAAAAGTRVNVRREPPLRRAEAATAPYFVEATRRVLENRFGEDVYTAPLRVYTTLDRKAQRTAEQQLEQQLRAIERGGYGRFKGKRYGRGVKLDDAPEYVQGAVVVMDVRTGDVRALVGGRDFAHSRFDRATQARRQAGSAFKPFVYAAAIADGYAPSQLVSDSALRRELAGGEVWEPRNATGEFEGVVSIRDALVRSKNVPTIRLAEDVGLHDVTRLAKRAGIRSELPSVPALAIGVASMTALELTAAYSAFARLGTAVAPRLITRVENADGKVVWEPGVERRAVMDSAAAYIITHMLQEAVTRGTARAVRGAGYTGAVAGKTGTTNDGSDAWFVGYTPKHVATVWIGFDRPQEIVNDASGGRLAAPVWARVMRSYAPDDGVWNTPSDIVELAVDPASGLVLRPGCTPRAGKARAEIFVQGQEPARACPAGKPVDVKRSVLRRTGDWFGRQWRRLGRWITRHFGTEKPQQAPREENYLGVPRLPRAQDVTVPQIDPDSLRFPVPLLVDTLMPDTILPDTALLDSLLLDTLLLDTMQVRDSLRRDSLRFQPVRPLLRPITTGVPDVDAPTT